MAHTERTAEVVKAEMDAIRAEIEATEDRIKELRSKMNEMTDLVYAERNKVSALKGQIDDLQSEYRRLSALFVENDIVADENNVCYRVTRATDETVWGIRLSANGIEQYATPRVVRSEKLRRVESVFSLAESPKDGGK